MEVTKAQVEAVLKTLPIGFYLGRPASIRLDENAATSYAELMTDSLVIALKNVTAAAAAIPPSAEKYWNVEKLTRCILYHEVGHLIYTAEHLMMCGTIRGLSGKQVHDGLNIIEDERIERRLQPAVLGVDFPNFVKLVFGYAPGSTPALPKNAGAQERLFYAVRFGVGSVADLKAVGDFWASVGKSRKPVLKNSAWRAIKTLGEQMLLLVKHFYDTQPTETEENPNAPENVPGMGSPENDEQAQGETPEQSQDGNEQPETKQGNGGNGGESEKEESQDGDGNEDSDESGESEEREQEETGDEDDGDSNESESEADEETEKSDGESGDDGDEEEDGYGHGEEDDGTEAESESAIDSGEDGDSENDVEAAEDGEDFEEYGGCGGGGLSEDEATHEKKALESLRKDFNKAFDWHELPEESPVKKSLARLLKRYRTRAGSARGEREEYATGRVNARAVCLGEDKLFRDRGHGAGRGSQKIALTAWIDVSGSFGYAAPKLNQLLKALRRAEKESSGNLVVDVVAMGSYLSDDCVVDQAMVEASPTPCQPVYGVCALILKKTASVDPNAGNILNADYNWCHKMTRHANARQFDLVVFDGSACSCNPTGTEIAAAKIWDNPRTTILSDQSNRILFDSVCKTARKQYMTHGYAEKLEELVAEVLERL